MTGLRRALTSLCYALLCVPFTVLAEEPSQLLQLNKPEPKQVSEKQLPVMLMSALPDEAPQFDGSGSSSVHVEESTWEDFVLHPQQSPHGGLLGKRFFSADYMYGQTDGTMFPNDFLDQFHGFAISLNSPLSPGDGTRQLAVDAFVGYSHAFGRDKQNVPMGQLTGSMDTGVFEVGLTFYTESISRLRPFVQLGYHGSYSKLSLQGPGGSANFREDDDSGLLRVGTEFDLSQRFVLRADLEIDGEESDESTFTGQLIFSPNDSEFFRIGAFTDLDGFFTGLLVGGGVKF